MSYFDSMSFVFIHIQILQLNSKFEYNDVFYFILTFFFFFCFFVSLGTPVIDEDTTDDETKIDSTDYDGTQYKLVGIIVHMGQANGGHYYSFIQ